MKSEKTLTKVSAIIGVIGIAVALLVILSGAQGGIGSIVGEAASSSASKVVCDVTIDTTFYGSPPDIMGASCVKIDTCGLGDLFSTQPLSLFTAEGKLVFDSGDKKAVQSISISRLSGDVMLRETLCTNSPTIIVKTLDKDGAQTDSKEVAVQ